MCILLLCTTSSVSPRAVFRQCPDAPLEILHALAMSSLVQLLPPDSAPLSPLAVFPTHRPTPISSRPRRGSSSLASLVVMMPVRAFLDPSASTRLHTRSQCDLPFAYSLPHARPLTLTLPPLSSIPPLPTLPSGTGGANADFGRFAALASPTILLGCRAVDTRFTSSAGENLSLERVMAKKEVEGAVEGRMKMGGWARAEDVA